MPLFYISTQVSKQMLNSLHSGAKETIAQLDWGDVCRLLGSFILTDISL